MYFTPPEKPFCQCSFSKVLFEGCTLVIERSSSFLCATQNHGRISFSTFFSSFFNPFS